MRLTFSQRVFRLREATGMSYEQAQRQLAKRSAAARHARAERRKQQPARRWWDA